MSVSYSTPLNGKAGATPQPPQVAGLRHVDDRVLPGLRRRRTGKTLRVGKRFVPEFVIEDTEGRRVRDQETLDRIRKLAIPPAWEEVWICRYPNGHIQATGRDARGRKQYRYHTRWREERDRTKYSRMVAFGNALPALRRQVDADLMLDGLPRRKVLATVVRLLETTFIRVGNEEYARTNKSFGLTTLKDRHVDFAPGEVRFHFRGKSGVSHQVAVHDPRVARIVRRCRDLPGQELFQYLSEDGKIQTIDSSDVNDYIHEIAGREFTAKDFRTWAGTVLAARAFQEIARAAEATPPDGGAPGRSAGRGGGRSPVGAQADRVRTATAAGAAVRALAPRRKPDAHADVQTSRSEAVRAGARKLMNRPSTRRTQKEVVRGITQVAEQLGNTPSVCRKCYVHPTVIASFLDGKLVDALTLPARKRAAPSPRAERRAAHAEQAAKRTGLRPDEAAVLALLTRADSEMTEVMKNGKGAASSGAAKTARGGRVLRRAARRARQPSTPGAHT